MPSDPIDHDDGGWQPRELPDDSRAAFLIVNEWAKELKAWNTRVRAMSAILEAELDLSPGQFAKVVDNIRNGKHSKADTREALGRPDRPVSSSFVASDIGPTPGGSGTTGVTGATDVVGHPPDPPFTDTKS